MAGAALHKVPGLPLPQAPEPLSERDALAELWTLYYIRNNAIKHIMLRFKGNVEVNTVVEKAKDYCKQRSVTFSWIEPSVVGID